MTDVFISYSRKDQAFVEELKQRLEGLELEVWVDIDGLYAGEEFWPEVTRAIDAAAAFVFVISPHSAKSQFCHKEADWAATVGKRIVPLCRADPGSADLPDQVAQRQWVFCREGDEAEAAMATLLSAIKADWVEIRQQARILRRAREWQEKKEDSSLLLRGKDLHDAIDWQTRNQGKPFIISQARILIGYEDYEAAIEQLEVAASIEGQAEIKPEIDLLYSVIHHCQGNMSISLEYFQKFATGLGGEFKGPRWNRAVAYYKGVKQRCQTTID
jgi:tetratricopeptide (TPR) repeat protein